MSQSILITRLAAAGGTALAAAFPAWLAPHLLDFGPSVQSWRGGFLVGGALAAAAIGFWSRWLGHATGFSPATCLAARTFPLRLTRLLFWVAIAASGMTVLALNPHTGLSAALLAGVIVYLMLLMPIAGLFFITGRLLQSLSTAPADVPVPGGGRQPVALRLTLAVQLPVLLCTLGMILVEQTNGVRYEQAIEQYGRERYERLLTRVLAKLPPATRRPLLIGLDPPPGIRITEAADGRRIFTAVPVEGTSVRPLTTQIPLLFVVLGVVLLALLHGRWLPREVTAELQAVRRALDALDQGRDPTSTHPYGLRETAELAVAFERAMAGFEARRLALSAAAAERRDSERRKAIFLGHLSHELKSPLNSILGFSELLLAGIDGPLRPRQRDQLAAVWRQGESLERFILALLDATRLGEAGRAASLLAPVPVTLYEVARALNDQLRQDPLETRTIEVSVIAPGTCRIDLTYTARAIRLLLGLLLDRIDAGRLRVTFKPTPQGAEVELQVLEVQADPAERIALRRALRTDQGPAPDPRSGAVPAVRLLLKALGDAQGSRFQAITDDETAWPRLKLELPGVG